jgi:hypothetical protein
MTLPSEPYNSGTPKGTERTAGTTSTKARQRFLDVLASGVTASAAASAAGIGRQTAYDLRNSDEEFAAGWEDALEAGTQLLEDEARRRALDRSDTLLIFLLKARRPHVYRDNVRVASVGVMRHEFGRDETVTAHVNHAEVFAVLEQAGLIAPGPLLARPLAEP